MQETEHHSSKDTAVEKYRILCQLSYEYTLQLALSFLLLFPSFPPPSVVAFLLKVLVFLDLFVEHVLWYFSARNGRKRCNLCLAWIDFRDLILKFKKKKYIYMYWFFYCVTKNDRDIRIHNLFIARACKFTVTACSRHFFTRCNTMRTEEGAKLQHVLSSRLSINLAIQPTPIDKHI